MIPKKLSALPLYEPATEFAREVVYVGMTLRDYFAGQALAAWTHCPTTETPEAFAEYAKKMYAIADAMLKVRDAD